MGLLDIFRRPPKDSKYARTLNGSMPIYSQFGTNIYASDVVQQALKCIVDEVKKLSPTHIRYNGNDPVPVKGNVQNVLDEPNELMTTSEFIEKVTWLLLMNYNAFIVPTYYTWIDENTGAEKRYYQALYPIKPTNVDFIQDASARLYVQFTFSNGTKTTYPYDDVIHIRYNYSVSQYMGGNENGQPDNQALLETLKMNKMLLDGIAKAMNASYSVNGVIKYNTYMDEAKMASAIEKFEASLKSGNSGILPLDLKGEYIPIEKKVQIVDKDTLQFIDSKILRNFGVPLNILTGDFTKSQLEAFYQKSIEPLALQLSQAFTKKMFTSREKGFGNKIKFYPKDLVFMTVAETLEMINTLAPTGALYENEKRVALGLRPLPELEGKRFQSLNWISSENADEYQKGIPNE